MACLLSTCFLEWMLIKSLKIEKCVFCVIYIVLCYSLKIRAILSEDKNQQAFENTMGNIALRTGFEHSSAAIYGLTC